MTTEDYIELHILEDITDRFSERSRIGRGGYGDVYKGVYNDKEIAVKLLHVDTLQGLDDKQFKNEVVNLLKVKHPNIVPFVGYCYAIKRLLVKHNGSDYFSDRIYRVLCFEYLQGGSLDKHLYGQYFAPNWSTRYNIIKGICEGLNFLHDRENPILHLDLKPANILLDSSMVPKVADFGLSRLFSGSCTHITETIAGTKKYMPPESMIEGMISVKNDVFSFGVVMIDIMIGSSSHSNYIEDNVTQLMQQAFKNCSNLIEDKTLYREAELDQVKKCISIATSCVHPERNNRPTMGDILVTLNKTEIDIPKRKLQDVLPLCPKSTMAIRKKMDSAGYVDNITNKHQHSDRMPTNILNINVQQVCGRQTTSYVGQTIIIGRDEENQKLLHILSQNIMGEMVILPIYGLGGIGKTTMARLVFNDPLFHEYSRVWVSIPKEFNLMKVGNSIISQLEGKTSYIVDMQMQYNHITKLFTGESIFIVLDDLWEENQSELHELMTMLKLGTPRRLIVIVTTRYLAIAQIVCGPVVTPYKLEILTDDMCWNIIKEKTAFQNRPDKFLLEHIGREIATKCGGMALAAQALGYMLREMDSSCEWESMRDSYFWDIPTSEDSSSRNDEVLSSLRLSYSKMSRWLQLCFSYCAVFQKGHNIVKCDLIQQWIAHGFLEPHKVFDSMQLCEKYVKQLLGMSFLEYSNAPLSDGKHDKDVTLFKMHDLVHDLARVMLADKVNKKWNFVEISCHYALLTDCSKKLPAVSPTNLKAIHFLDCGEIKLHGDAFSSAECLRVLDLSECIIETLPDSIGRLKHLRFLHAPQIKIWISNSITELSELTYLNLTGSRNITLPESIGNLKGLLHLDLSGCRGLYHLPASFTELKQLVHLDLSRCYVSTSDAFGGFTKLQYLNLSFPHSFYFGKPRPDRRGLAKVVSSFTKLMYLNLSGCQRIMAPSEDEVGSLLESISTLSNLEHFDFSHNRFSSIPESFGTLCMLHTLDLSWCSILKQLPESMYQMGSLKFLNLNGVRLPESVLSRLKIASLPDFVVRASSHEGSSNISLLQPTNPDYLNIKKLENVRSADEARDIELKEKRKMKRLSLEWTIDAERFVDDKDVLEQLVPPSSVDELHITGYMSVSIPDWLMDIRHYLPNLKSLNLTDLPKCNNLPLLGQLPKLHYLCLRRMGSLEEWNTEYTSGEEDANELLFPKLRHLRIEQCAKLRIKPCLPRAISYLAIDYCDVLLSSWEESSSPSRSSQVTDLYVRGSKLAISEWKLLHHLPALSELTIDSCSVLTTSIENIQHIKSLRLKSLSPDQAELPSWLLQLKSLHKLELVDCESMTSLPEWLGQLTSLKRFQIFSCERITYYPGSIQQLTKLEYLYINGCPELQRLITEHNKGEQDEACSHKKRSSFDVTYEEDRSDESYEEDIAEDSDEDDIASGPITEASPGPLDKRLIQAGLSMLSKCLTLTCCSPGCLGLETDEEPWLPLR